MDPQETHADAQLDIDFDSGPPSTTQREDRQQAAHERHKGLQLSGQAYTVLMPVRAHLFAVVKAFQYEAKRNGTMPYFTNTLRTMLLWAEVSMGRSDDDILDSVDDELVRIRKKQGEFKKNRGVA
jgi:hypothetical protein